MYIERSGVGIEEEKKRKQREENQDQREREQSQLRTFQQYKRQRFNDWSVQADLKKAQQACEILDIQHGIDENVFWKLHIQESANVNTLPLLDQGYSKHVVEIDDVAGDEPLDLFLQMTVCYFVIMSTYPIVQKEQQY